MDLFQTARYKVGERIKNYSHEVSPGGAQKLTAQSMGVMIHVMNESLRAQATGLKLQAQSMAIENHKDKEQVRQMAFMSSELDRAMKAEKATFSVPRF